MRTRSLAQRTSGGTPGVLRLHQATGAASTARMRVRPCSDVLIHNDSCGLCCALAATHRPSPIHGCSPHASIRPPHRFQSPLQPPFSVCSSALMMRRAALLAAAMCMLLALAAQLTEVSPRRSRRTRSACLRQLLWLIQRSQFACASTHVAACRPARCFRFTSKAARQWRWA